MSQLSSKALLQTLELSKAPVAATHSNARALIDNGRNLSDAELDAIKANGGVVQLTPFSAYIHKITDEERARISAIRVSHGLAPEFVSYIDGQERLSEAAQSALQDDLVAALPQGSLSEYVDHIDYIAKRIGWQHVGIGSDFNHGSGVPGFYSAADAPNVTAELIKRGYSAEQVKAIWGGNFLRVWRAAHSARAS